MIRVPLDKVQELSVALQSVDRLDLFFKKECAQYWNSEDVPEPSVKECVEFLKEKFPQKKSMKEQNMQVNIVIEENAYEEIMKILVKRRRHDLVEKMIILDSSDEFEYDSEELEDYEVNVDEQGFLSLK